MRESRNDGQRGGGRGGGRGTGRGRGGRFGRDSVDNGNSYSNNNGFSGGYRQPEEGDLDKSSERRGGYGAPRGGAPRGGRRGGFSNGDAADGERPRRVYERHSGTGRGLVLSYYGSSVIIYIFICMFICVSYLSLTLLLLY